MKKIIALAFVFGILSCNQQGVVDTKADEEKLLQLSKEWSQAAVSKDLEKTISYWADDAILMSAGQPKLNGKQEIKQMVAESFTMPGFEIKWQPKSVHISESGDMAYILEDSQLSISDSTGKIITQKNDAVSIWRKQSDGQWKNVVDISTPALSQ